MPDNHNKILRYSPESALKNPVRLLGEMWTDLLGSRDLAYRLFERNLKGQFRQSMLGYVWLFIQPLSTTLLWFLLNSSGVVKITDVGIPYPAFVLIGSLLYQAFSDSLNSPLRELNASKQMLIKLKFPREAVILAGLYQTCFTSLIRLTLLIPIFIFVDLSVTWTLLLFPIGYFALVVLGLAIGMTLTPLGLLYTDINRGITLALQLGTYATPVVYPLAKEGFLSLINKINPVTYVLSTTRDILTGGPYDMLMPAIYISIGSVFVFLISWVIFRVVIPIIIERLGM